MQEPSCRALKPTVLGWAARFGVERAFRRTLAYHAKPKDRSMTIYSRDELSVPPRWLAEVDAAIREGRFHRDLTRSGHWSSTPVVPPPEEASSGYEDALESGSTSSVNLSDDGQDPPADEGQGYVLNIRSGLLHLDGDEGRFKCDRVAPMCCDYSAQWPSEAGARCAKCFRG